MVFEILVFSLSPSCAVSGFTTVGWIEGNCGGTSPSSEHLLFVVVVLDKAAWKLALSVSSNMHIWIGGTPCAVCILSYRSVLALDVNRRKAAIRHSMVSWGIFSLCFPAKIPDDIGGILKRGSPGCSQAVTTLYVIRFRQ